MVNFNEHFFFIQTCLYVFSRYNADLFIRCIILQCHWVQTKRHRLWFSTKSCSCYPTKTYVSSVILILKLTSIIYTFKVFFVEHHAPFVYMFLIEVKFNLKMRIVYVHKFSLSNNYITSLRITTCDAFLYPVNVVDCPSVRSRRVI